jgi:hypothetical protein
MSVESFSGSLTAPAFPTLYLDEDIPWGTVGELIQRGYEATYARSVLPSGTPDDDHIRYAAEHGYIVVTRNHDDFVLLHHAWRSWSRMWQVHPSPEHSGILITPGNWDAARIADEVDRLVQSGLALTNALYIWTPSRAWERRPGPA